MQALEQQIIEIIQGTLENLGLELVKVTLKGTTHQVLEILIDRIDGEKINLQDCRTASSNISALLDVEDIISEKYFLEVSSAGMERPLIKFQDYIRFSGREVTIKLNSVLNGQTRYQGQIIKAENNQIYLAVTGDEVIIAFDMIKKASLVLTDAMFKNLMKKNLKRQ